MSSRRDSALQEALLIQAQSNIVQLEAERSRLRQHLTEEKVKSGPCISLSSLEDEHVLERCHKLEQERTVLNEELSSTKKKVVDLESKQLEREGDFASLKTLHGEEKRELNTQLERLNVANFDLEATNNRLQVELNELELSHPLQQLDQLDQVEANYSESMQGLRRKLANLHSVEAELLSTQSQVALLQRQLRTYRQENQFVGKMRGELGQMEALEHEVKMLREENQQLLQDRANGDLLRYQVQTLRSKCKELQNVQEEVVHLRLEKEQLEEGQGSVGSVSLQVLQIQLAEMQQREVVAMRECGELNTQCKLLQKQLQESQSEVTQLLLQLKKERNSILTWEDKVHKLERRLLFVTKLQHKVQTRETRITELEDQLQEAKCT